VEGVEAAMVPALRVSDALVVLVVVVLDQVLHL